MSGTIVEKILSAKVKNTVQAGDLLITDVDVTMMHDANAPSVVSYFESMKEKAIVKSPELHMVVLDHRSPATNVNAANSHKMLREFARKHNLRLVDMGEAICHQALLESGKVLPGGVVVGTDSHTCTVGALNAFSTGVGASDLAVALAGNKCWFKVPQSIRINLHGKPAKKIMSKDLSLYIIRELTERGATYQCIEFAGDALPYLSVDERAALCNMMVETGAKCALMPCDSVLSDWFAQRGICDIKGVAADADAKYSQVVDIDMSKLEPLVAVPPRLDTVQTAASLKDIPIQQVYIGSCTNGRFEDFKVAADILKGKQKHPHVRLILVPASKEVERKMLESGVYQTLLEAGGAFMMPCCGPCGLNGGVIGDGENALATSNRNIPGKMGSEKGIYVTSPLVAAYSALAGHITAGDD